MLELQNKINENLQKIKDLKSQNKQLIKEIIGNSPLKINDKIMFNKTENYGYIKEISTDDLGVLLFKIAKEKKDGTPSLILFNISDKEYKLSKTQSIGTDYFYIDDLTKVGEYLKQEEKEKKLRKKITSNLYSINYGGSLKIVKAFSKKDIKDKLRVSSDFISLLGDSTRNTLQNKKIDIDITILN